jgi:signal peptidase II
MKFKKETWLFAGITSLVVLLDQILKLLVLKFQPSWQFWFIYVDFIQNTGAGFGILKGHTLALGIISLIVTLAILIFYKKFPKDWLFQVLLALFLGGTVGNLIDRLGRSYVIDYLGTTFWPAFNLADACITVATIGLILYLIREEIKIRKLNKK